MHFDNQFKEQNHKELAFFFLLYLCGMPLEANLGRRVLWRPRLQQGEAGGHPSAVTVVACLYKGGQTMFGQLITVDPNNQQVLKVA